METDEHLRQRIYAKLGWTSTFVPGEVSNCEVASGLWLDQMAAKVGLTRLGAAPPDPLGDAVRAAQERPETPDPTYRPDDFTAPGFDADAAYRRAMGGGS